jgi:hypothetical protein
MYKAGHIIIVKNDDICYLVNECDRNIVVSCCVTVDVANILIDYFNLISLYTDIFEE